MIVKVKLFASLRKYLPKIGLGKSANVRLEDGARIAQLYEFLQIPEEEIKLAFVNGVHQDRESLLKDGDEVGIFPPVGGG